MNIFIIEYIQKWCIVRDAHSQKLWVREVAHRYITASRNPTNSKTQWRSLCWSLLHFFCAVLFTLQSMELPQSIKQILHRPLNPPVHSVGTPPHLPWVRGAVATAPRTHGRCGGVPTEWTGGFSGRCKICLIDCGSSIDCNVNKTAQKKCKRLQHRDLHWVLEFVGLRLAVMYRCATSLTQSFWLWASRTIHHFWIYSIMNIFIFEAG